MATGQQFNLRWNNHTNNILQVFLEQLSSENLVDVTLSCQGQFLKAHKMILSACSPYFQELFRQHQVQHPVIIMNGMKFVDIKLVVEFMYRGEIKVLETELDGLLAVAETLQVKGLSNVRNKYEKGDIQCAEQQQTVPPAAEQDGEEGSDSKLGTPLHLRRKRRKRSNSPNVERVGMLDPLEATGETVTDNASTGASSSVPGTSKPLPFMQVTMNDYIDDDDLPATIKVEPPDIRDIDEEEPSGWESPKLVIDLPEVTEHPKANSVSVKSTPRPIKAKVGSPSQYGKARYLMDYPAGPSQENMLLANELLANQEERKQVSQWLKKRTGKIPRPPNAFMIFANEWRRKLAFQYPSESNKEISVRLGIMWKNLSSDTKEGYYTASRQADEEHKRKYPGYYYSPKEARIRKTLKQDLAMARKGPKALEAMHLVKVLMTDGNETPPFLLVQDSQLHQKELPMATKKKGLRNLKHDAIASRTLVAAVDSKDNHNLPVQPAGSESPSMEVTQTPIREEPEATSNEKEPLPPKDTKEETGK